MHDWIQKSSMAAGSHGADTGARLWLCRHLENRRAGQTRMAISRPGPGAAVLRSSAPAARGDDHWTAGQHGVATWHGAGPVMANKIMLQRVIDYTHEKDIVKQTLKLEENK